MATQGIASDPKQTPIGTAGTKLETYTQTRYNIDSNGKIDPKSAKTEILYNNSTIPGVKNWVPAAASTDGGKTWDTTSKRYQKLDGTPVLSPEAQKSLREGALRTTTNQQIQLAATKAKLKPEQTKVLSDAAKNKGSSDPNKGGGDPDNAELTKDLKASKNTRIKFPENLRYPKTLESGYQDVIVFNMVKYEPRKLNEGGAGGLGSFGPREDYTKRFIGSVILPIPSGISDANSVNWQSDEMTSAQKALADLAKAGITGGPGAMADTASRQAGQVQESSSEIGTGLAAYFTEQATNVKNILSRTQGAVQNPNMELLFMGPQLRSFSFTFKLSARSGPEAQDIRRIIRFFKQGMAPQRTESQLFLKAPHTFQLIYKHRNKEHKFLNKFKECALLSFSVDYTPEGQYATFIDGAMVSYGITMQFQELEPIFNEDYGNAEFGGDENQDTQIGY